MKFLIVGLGSMGKRRIRNLQKLGFDNLIGFDIKKERLDEVSKKFKINTMSNIENAIKLKPDIMIISTPPDLHMKYAKIAIEKKIHFFTEADVVIDEMSEIINLLKNSKIVGVPSCTLRFHTMFLKIQQILQDNKNLGRILAILHHQGQYLPDWHPWEEYTEFYVSNKKTGAGREMVPFELVWMTALFGKIHSVKGTKTRTGILDSEIDDLYNVILEFKNGIKGMLTVDVISRIPYRQIKILTENGVIESDWNNRKLIVYTKSDGYKEFTFDSGDPEKNYIHGEDTYVNEIKGFIQTIKHGKKFPYSFEEDHYILKILEKIELSSEIEKTVIVEN